MDKNYDVNPILIFWSLTWFTSQETLIVFHKSYQYLSMLITFKITTGHLVDFTTWRVIFPQCSEQFLFYFLIILSQLHFLHSLPLKPTLIWCWNHGIYPPSLLVFVSYFSASSFRIVLQENSLIRFTCFLLRLQLIHWAF